MLADVRTRDLGINPIAPNRGLPEDISDGSLRQLTRGWDEDSLGYSKDRFTTVEEKVAYRNDSDCFGFSWVSAQELLDVEYGIIITSMDAPSESRTLREALGENYFERLAQLSKLQSAGSVRLVFCFY